MPLNDPRWGRSSDEEPRKDDRPADEEPPRRPNDDERRDDNRRDDNRRDDNRRNDRRRDDNDDGMDDLDRLWKEFSELIHGAAGRGKSDQRHPDLRSRDDFSRDDVDDRADDRDDDRSDRNERVERPQARRYGEDDRSSEQQDRRYSGDRPTGGRGIFGGMGGMGGFGGLGGKRPNLPAGGKGTGIGMSVILGLAVLAWGATGFYIVPEGQSGIVTTFGRYAETTAAGFRWHLPMPVQDVQIVDVSSVRTTEIGFAGRSDRLREALMLTDDENIVDVQFTVQYRIKPGDGARDYVFRIRQPNLTVTQAAESAMREVVGRKTMDSVLFESKAEIAEAVKKTMQSMLDRYSSGIEVMSVAIQNAQPPQQVQAAFNDAVKAGQDRERSINLGEAYRNAVIPKAEGTAARLKEEALGYQARIVEAARGDADRFTALQSQYAKAPEVTRDRLYVDTVRDVMKNVTKVYVDAKGGNNLLYLPLDKIVNTTKTDAMTQAQKDAAALADHGVTVAQSAVEGMGSAQTSSAAPGNEYQRMLRERP